MSGEAEGELVEVSPSTLTWKLVEVQFDSRKELAEGEEKGEGKGEGEVTGGRRGP